VRCGQVKRLCGEDWFARRLFSVIAGASAMVQCVIWIGDGIVELVIGRRWGRGCEGRMRGTDGEDEDGDVACTCLFWK